MIAWINVAVMFLTAVLTLFYYVKSVGPAALEKKIGERAYKKCTRYRLIASIFMTINFAGYVVYFFYPLQIGLPNVFPWDYWISVLIAVIIAIPSGYIWFIGMKDAGEETLNVKKDHIMYGGIYRKMRHPQAVGELPFAWVIAFLLHSPFLFFFSFLWAVIFYVMCKAEEKDLVIRYGEKYIEYMEKTGLFFPKRNK